MIAIDDVPFWQALIVGGLLVAGAIAMLVIVNRAANGTVGPNPGVGIRTTATRRSPAAWQAAHRAARPFIQFGGMALMVTGIASIALGSVPEAYFVVLLIGVGLMLLAVVAGSIVGQRAARATPD